MVGPVERPPTLTEAVVDSIRDSIFRRDFKPGDPLREMELGETLEVSRSTIREALLILHEEQLIEIVPHKGAYVAQLSETTARELYTLRALIEPFALRLAMEERRYIPEDLAELESLALRLNDLEKSPGQVYEIARTDVAFHHLICSRSNHQLLLDAYRGLQSLTWLYVSHFQHYQTDAYNAAPTHYDVVGAIKKGDIGAAAELLEGHISRSGEALLASMGDPNRRRRL